MKNIQFFEAAKYKTKKVIKLEDMIYLSKDQVLGKECCVTSLSFEQEPELGEGTDSSNISQYPLEDILDEFDLALEDEYLELNAMGTKTCYVELGSLNPTDIRKVLGLIGKHVYNKEVEKNGIKVVELVIE